MIDIQNIPNGIHTDITIEQYHANRTHLSATTLKKARESLKHFHWFREGKIVQEDKPHFSFGNAFELALLDPKDYLNKVVVMPENEWIEGALAEKPELQKPRNSGYYQKAYAKFTEENKGKYTINDTGKESFDVIEEMLSSCYQDKYIQGLIKNTEYQLSLFWDDPQTGIKLKTRPDICKRKKNVIVNVKTTEDGSPTGFSKDMVKYDYPLQAIIEMSGCLNTGLMDEIDLYLWLVCEKVAPFNATIYEFRKEDHGAVRDSLQFTLDRIKKSEEQNKWPGYSDRADNEYGVLHARIPLWYSY